MVILMVIAIALLVAVVFRYHLKRKSYARESIQAGDPNTNPLQGMNFSKRGWTFADIADFEFLLLSERHADRVEASQRDRKIYLELVNNAPPDAVREEIDLLRSWLEARRHLGGIYLGGEELVSSWKLLITATVLCSFVAGAGHASGVLLLLDQGGHVSAIKAVFWTVGVQLAITVFGIAI